MAHILLMTSGLRGMVNASLEVARRLQASGHRVTYACPHDVRELVARHGVEYRQLPAVNRQPAPERARQSGESRLAHKRAEWSSRGERRAAGVDALGMEPLQELLSELAPDLALLDFDLEEHVVACATSGVRTVILSQWFEFRKRSGLPPLGSKLVQGSAFERWMAWSRVRLRSRVGQASTYLRYFGTDRRGVIAEYARRKGFPSSGLWSHDWSTLFAFDDLPVWSMTAAELDFPHARRSSFTYVGPMVRMDRMEDDLAEDARDRLDRVIRDARQSGKRVLYASLSSMASAGDFALDDKPDKDPGEHFIGRLVQAVASRDDWVLVLGLGGNEGALDALNQRLGGPLPPQIEPFPLAPQLHALKQADLFISHGGIHSIHEAFLGTTPTVVYSASAFDQDGCAARLMFHGAASVGSRQESAKEIAARLSSALADEPLMERTREVATGFSQYETALEGAVAALLAAPQ